MKRVALACAVAFSVIVLAAFVMKDDKAKYMGAETCKSCHKAKEIGEQYNKWKETKMAKAYETLATPKAKEIGKKNGVDDPQKSDKCLKCHTTAFGVVADRLGKKFDIKQGVQCEACHGPAEQHVKSRMAAGDEDDAAKHANAQKEMPLPDKTACMKCHNQESVDIVGENPYWDKEKKEFLFEKAMKEIVHPNPKWHKK